MPRATLDALRAHLPRDEAVPDVRTDRGVPLDLPAAGRGRSRGPTRSAARSRTPRSSCCATTAANARPTSPGELVHRGALVGMGYWNDPAKTAERYKPLPRATDSPTGGLVMPEIAVFSGDTVRRDAEGYLYFIGRRDEMIKTSGYRVSPTEIEEALYATGLRRRGRGVRRRASGARPGDRRDRDGRRTADEPVDVDARQARVPAMRCRRGCSPRWSSCATRALPRNPNGKIDRKALSRRSSSIRSSRAPRRARSRA